MGKERKGILARGSSVHRPGGGSPSFFGDRKRFDLAEVQADGTQGESDAGGRPSRLSEGVYIFHRKHWGAIEHS